MELEHCFKSGCDVPFTTTNYKITTTPRQEWSYIVKGERCPDMQHSRRIPSIEELLKVPSVVAANLSYAEVVAVVLYSGPMFHVYNTILRRWPEEAYDIYNSGGNTFAATIYVLVSAVQKLSRSAPLPGGLVLYRGLGGALDLPENFFRSDERGCKGYAEWAFMSTTSDKKVALLYSGVKEGLPSATVLVIRVGAVDRGACIRELSQYTDEVEYLWLPCSWLEPVGRVYMEATPDGVVRMIPCDARANLRAATTEELIGRRKRMHLTAFRFLVDDLGRRLDALAKEHDAEARLLRDPSRQHDEDGRRIGAQQWTVSGYLKRIVEQCMEVVASHEAIADIEYTDESRLRGLVLAMLDTLHMAPSKLLHWLNDPSSLICFLHGDALRSVHRLRKSFLRRTLAESGEARRRDAVELCRLHRLMEADIEETNEIGESRLVAAAADGRSPADLRLLVAAGADVNRTVGKKRSTALHAAALAGHVDLVRALAELQADLNACTDSGATPVYLAARHGHAECIRALKEAGADVNRPNKMGRTPVSIAARNGHADCIKALQEAGADVDRANDQGATPAHVAAEHGHDGCLTALKEAGADVHRANRDGVTPMHLAAQKGHAKCVRVLAHEGAAVD